MKELLLLISGLIEIIRLATSVAAQAQAEGREPTADEIAQVKARQAEAEARWQSLLPK